MERSGCILPDMIIERRAFLVAMGTGTAAIVRAQGTRSKGAVPSVKALVFDTFGTVVDWRGSIIAEGTAWGKTKGITADWAKFADRWRDGYAPAMDKVRKGEMPWTKLDVLHRMILEDVLTEFKMNGLTEEEQVNLVALAWVGRGTYDIEEWDDAIDTARTEHNKRTGQYLLGLPLLGDYLAEGLEAFDEDFDDETEEEFEDEEIVEEDNE